MRPFLGFIFLAVSLSALAGEPLATEDASILPAGSCQLETWWRHQHNVDVASALPACSPNAHVEIAVGGASYRSDDAARHAVLLLQVKPILYRDAERRFTFGAVVGTLRDTGRASERGVFHEAIATLIGTWEINATLRVHVNGGIAHSRHEFTTGTFAFAVEGDVAPRWTLMAELYRDSPGRPQVQLGSRYTVIENRLEIFASAGERLSGGSEERFFKIGLRVQADFLR